MQGHLLGMILLVVPIGDVRSKRTAPLLRASTVKLTLTCSSRPISHALSTVKVEDTEEPKSGVAESGCNTQVRWAGTACQDLARDTIFSASIRPNPKDLQEEVSLTETSCNMNLEDSH